MEESSISETDQRITSMLESTRAIAVVGIKSKPDEDAYRVPEYMQQAGYKIVPINPKLQEVLGEPCSTSLTEMKEPVELVNIFRAPENIPAHVDEILELVPRPAAVWMQLGIHHGESTARLRNAGIDVIEDRCIMVDHRRLLGPKRAAQ